MNAHRLRERGVGNQCRTVFSASPAPYQKIAQRSCQATSVKRMLARGDMPLSRIDAICRALTLDFADLARRVADAPSQLKQRVSRHGSSVGLRWPSKRIAALHRLPIQLGMGCALRLALRSDGCAQPTTSDP